TGERLDDVRFHPAWHLLMQVFQPRKLISVTPHGTAVADCGRCGSGADIKHASSDFGAPGYGGCYAKTIRLSEDS
ncbi:hypothetical protein, partial [Enterobacter cloacae]|uniref:hypothetical protein n=1 Tax=Enterobacter cloacae TaxID=550 RepID=UPI003D6819C5